MVKAQRLPWGCFRYFECVTLSRGILHRSFATCLSVLGKRDSQSVCSALCRSRMVARETQTAECVPSLLVNKQAAHIENFVSCYVPESVRPKLHFSLHLSEQLGRKGRVVDAFPTERKHKRFKSEVAVKVARLRDFAKVALLKCVEADIRSRATCLIYSLLVLHGACRHLRRQ